MAEILSRDVDCLFHAWCVSLYTKKKNYMEMLTESEMLFSSDGVLKDPARYKRCSEYKINETLHIIIGHQVLGNSTLFANTMIPINVVNLGLC